MQLICESLQLEEYLGELEVVDYSHPAIQDIIRHVSLRTASVIERVRATYEFVRDTIHHSCDIQSSQVPCTASEVLLLGEGLCFAKAHLLAALLRAQGIPTGFCYQRLILDETLAEKRYTLHGLNAVYLFSEQTWIRLDARGNKPGVQAEFSLTHERLAFTVDSSLGEVDYPTIYTAPLPKVLQALRGHPNCFELCAFYLPDEI